MHSAILPISLIVVLILLTPRRRDLTKRCEDLVRQLPGRQLEDLEPLMSAFAQLRAKMEAFHRASDGLKGAAIRLRTVHTYLQLVWELFHADKLSLEDASYIWRQAVMQGAYTVLALPEAALCSLIRPLPHFMAYMAFCAHRSVILRCEVAFAVDGAPECVLRIRELL